MSGKLYSYFLHSNLVKAFQIFFILFASTLFVQNSQAAPVLVAESYAVVADDGDGAIEPDECVDITVTLRNDGDAITNVLATLSSNTANVTAPVANATQSYPDIAGGGGTATNATPFRVSVSPVFACGLPANLTLTVNSDQGPFSVPVTLATGNVGPLSQSFSESPNVTISNVTPIDRTHNFSGITTVTKVTVSVYATHSRDADVQFSLVGPDGTIVDLSSNNGGSGDNYGTGCGSKTTFDDAAATSITTGSAPFNGSYQPESTLSAFIGKTGLAANGNWTFRVRDSVMDFQIGTLVCWSMTIEYASSCSGSNGVCPGSVDVVAFDSANVTNGNFVADINDCFDLSVGLRNDGTADATQISDTILTTTTPGVTILQGNSAYPDIAQGSAQANGTSFQVQTSPSVACGTMIDFLLTGSSASGPFSIPFQLPVGQNQSVTATGPNSIPDGDSNGVDLDIPVSSIDGNVSKVTLNMHVSHTSLSDLSVSLVGPDNTTVLLSSGNGGSDDNYGSDCDNTTNFNDDAADPIENGVASFVGTFIPQEALSAFDGKDPNGTWKLHVTDTNLNGEVGQIECATLNFVSCIDGECCPVITVDGEVGNGVTGVAYNATVTADGGTEPYTFEITSGSLPDGISLDSAGNFTGTPTVPGDYTFEVTATDAHGCPGSKEFSINVACPVVTLDDTLADGSVGVAYVGSIVASGGTGPYNYTVTSGLLPAGVAFDVSGALTGNPQTPGSYDFSVEATDVNGCKGSALYNIGIACPTITIDQVANPGSPVLSAGTINVQYSEALTASGGSSPYTFSTTDTLPTGLTLGSDGVVSGLLVQPVTNFSFSVTVTDVNGCSQDKTFTFTFGVMGPGCIFCDDFNDTNFTTPLWTTKGGVWSAATGNLEGLAPKKGTAFGSDFGGCPGGECTVIANVKVQSGGQSVHLFGWYLDKKNYVELRISENKDQILLKSKVNKVKVAKQKVNTVINVDQTYLVKIVFDGTFFQVYLDNVQIMTNVPKGADPSSLGTVAFRVKSLSSRSIAGDLQDIQVLP